MENSVDTRIKKAEEFRAKNALLWAPVEFYCIVNDAAPNLIIPIDKYIELVTRGLSLKAYVLAEFCTECTLADTSVSFYPDLSLRNKLFIYHNSYYMFKSLTLELLILNKFFAKEVKRDNPNKEAILERWYNLLIPQLVLQTLPVCLNDLTVEKK